MRTFLFRAPDLVRIVSPLFVLHFFQRLAELKSHLIALAVGVICYSHGAIILLDSPLSIRAAGKCHALSFYVGSMKEVWLSREMPADVYFLSRHQIFASPLRYLVGGLRVVRHTKCLAPQSTCS